MRNIFFTKIITISFVTIFMSCKHDLNLSPISDYNSGSFYKTEGDFEYAVNGIYKRIQDLYGGTYEWAIESRSDNVRNDGSNSYAHNLVHRFIDGPTNEATNEMWRAYWTTIDRANAVIDKIGDIQFSNPGRQSQLKGEALFLRGYCYFQLGWLFGGVPLIDHQMTLNEITATPRSTQDQTFSFAATDLTQAAQMLPPSYSGADIGKATKFAAKGILARMYLFQKKYAEAKTQLNDIITLGNFTFALNFSNIFSEASDNNGEHIFDIQYKSGNVGQGNPYVARQVPEFLRSSVFPSGGTSGAPPVSSDLYDKYETGDLRRDYTILKGFTNSSGQIDNTSMFFIKYAHPSSIPANKYDFEVNIPLLRFTDIKMMYAEVLNEEGYSSAGEAFNILNQVRARAGVSSLTSIEVPNQIAFRSALLNERRLEFANEFLRWFDLVRTGNAVTVMNLFLTKPEEGSGTYVMHEYQSIFAIPQYELNVNTNSSIIFQNPGYN